MPNTNKFRMFAEVPAGLSEEKRQTTTTEADDFATDDSSEMQMISIRLQKKLVEDLKRIAKHYGIGYQPLIRQLLTRFVIAEAKQMMNDAIAHTETKRKRQSSSKAA